VAAAKRLEVRVITVAPVTYGTWDPQHYEAYTATAKKLGWHLQIAQAIPYAKVAQVLDRWGADHVDIVFSTNAGYQRFLLAAASKYRKTAWVNFAPLSSTLNLPNVAAYTYDTCQLGFLQGAAAALVSKTHRIGAVGSIPVPSAKSIVAGARYGAKIAVPGTTIDFEYSGDFVNAQAAQDTAVALMGKGADVILGVTQSIVSPRIAVRAQAAHRYYIGAYADQSKQAPRSVVTSVVVDFTKAYELVGEQRLAGRFKPGMFTEGVRDGFIKILPFRLGFAKQAARMHALSDRLAGGILHISNCTPA
jgi:basic membrane protein A